MNHFGDLTQDEYRFFYLGMRSHFSQETKRNGSTYLKPSHVKLPAEVDWRQDGYVTPVKNQGNYVTALVFDMPSIFRGSSETFATPLKLVLLHAMSSLTYDNMTWASCKKLG